MSRELKECRASLKRKAEEKEESSPGRVEMEKGDREGLADVWSAIQSLREEIRDCQLPERRSGDKEREATELQGKVRRAEGKVEEQRGG